VLLGGGYLCFVLGVEVNRTAWEQPPQQWTLVLADTELADGELCRAETNRLNRSSTTRAAFTSRT
jgi:hypothetical protein